MKENIKRDSAIDLFNSILKTARDAGALQELCGWPRKLDNLTWCKMPVK